MKKKGAESFKAKPAKKYVVKRHKVTSKVMSQWKPLSKEMKSSLMALLEDSMSTFSSFDDAEINIVLHRIRKW